MMPTFRFGCTNEECNNEWEELYMPGEDLPTTCEKCGKPIKRLLCGMPAVKVELYGQELMSKLKADGQKLKKRAATDENFLANVVGESTYQDNVKKFGG